VLVAAVLAVYGPTLKYEFLGWDDDINVVNNPVAVSGDGLVSIWTSRQGPQGFPNYPLFYTSLWAEYWLWGANPIGFHATNVALHALNAVLVLVLMRRLGLSRSVAWLTAGLFALHPLQVESVAWITELKNILSGTFYLTAFLLYARHRKTGGNAVYWLALVAFAAALLSKTASVTLVASLFLADYFIFGGVERGSRASVRQSFNRLLPFALLGVIAGGMLMGTEARPAEAAPLSCRPLVAASAVWFYAAKLIAPFGLAPIYPRWAVQPASIMWWLPFAGLAAAVLIAWRFRQALGGKALWGLSHFIVTLLPALGLTAFAFHDLSFVADRFVYLACIGLFMAVALSIEAAMLRFWSRPKTAVAFFGSSLVILGASATVTLQQLPVWRNTTQLWSFAVARNPDSWMAQHNLGSVLYLEGRDDEALQRWRRCLEIRPDYPSAYVKVATVLAKKGDFAGAREYLHRAVDTLPPRMVAGALAEMFDLARNRSSQPELRALIGGALAAGGCYPEAVRVLQENQKTAPNCVESYSELAWIRATADSPQWRDGVEALRLAERAVRLAGKEDALLLDVQAAALAEAGFFTQAVSTARRAIDCAAKSGDDAMASSVQARLSLYERRQAYREPVRAGVGLPRGKGLSQLGTSPSP
jgi:tetratricopeptide (TPR) repeat protein